MFGRFKVGVVSGSLKYPLPHIPHLSPPINFARPCADGGQIVGFNIDQGEGGILYITPTKCSNTFF